MKHIAAALALAWPLAASAVTGNELYTWRTQNVQLYRGYVMGFVEGARSTEYANPDTKLVERLCLPEGVTFGQVGDIIGRYLEQHPENRHMDAAAISWHATVSSFPCASRTLK